MMQKEYTSAASSIFLGNSYVSAKLCFKPSMKSHNDGSLYNAVAVGGVHQVKMMG
ncbi:hypothetical protein YC2023_054445 [Brassica napus]